VSARAAATCDASLRARRLGVLLSATAMSAALAFAQPAAAPRSNASAWRFAYEVRPTAAGKPIAGGEMRFDVAIWNGVARITVQQGPLRAFTGDTGTILLRAADSTLSIINPARREVLRASVSELSALMGGPAGAAEFSVTDVASATRVLGEGPRAFGRRTRRAELTQRYTLSVRTATMQRQLRTEQQLVLDISREIGRLDPAFRAFAEQFARTLSVPGPVRQRLRAAERGLPDGFPVAVTTTAVTVSGSDTLRTVTQAQAGQLRREGVDTLTFQVPAGYRVTEMSRLLQRRAPEQSSSRR
jgi:hypothetical protein